MFISRTKVGEIFNYFKIIIYNFLGFATSFNEIIHRFFFYDTPSYVNAFNISYEPRFRRKAAIFEKGV